MRPTLAARAFALAGLIALALPAHAGDSPAAPLPAPAATPAPAAAPAPEAPDVLRQRIIRGIADGLAQHGATITPAPPVAASHPAPIGIRMREAPLARSAAAVPPPPADTTADGAWHDLLAGNERFVAEHPLARPLTRERAQLAQEQHPRTVVLGCADSRVSPELVFDQSLGDLFVVRTAGNIVDPIALGSLEYAVEHLHAKLLVVLGHTDCGAVRAAAASDDMPSAYLQAIVDRIRPTVQRLAPCFEGEELIGRSVIANARQSAQDVLTNSALLRTAESKGRLKVVSAIYDVHSGVVTPVSAPAATARAQAPGR